MPEKVDHGEPLREVLAPAFRLQLVREPGRKRVSMQGPDDAADIVRRYLEFEDREHFVALMLDAKNRVIGLNTVSIGTLYCALVSPREVFKAAILANACAIIVAHNHPSGDPTPSPEDIEVTKRLHEAGKLLEIEVLDHIIVGENGKFASLKSLGLL